MRTLKVSLAASVVGTGVWILGAARLLWQAHPRLAVFFAPLFAAVLLEYKTEGMDAEAVARQVKRRFPTMPIILLSAYACMPERILWLVDEYVMRSELRERLILAIERATGRSQTDEKHNPPSGTDAA